jgi:hypothetical protein
MIAPVPVTPLRPGALGMTTPTIVMAPGPVAPPVAKYSS